MYFSFQKYLNETCIFLIHSILPPPPYISAIASPFGLAMTARRHDMQRAICAKESPVIARTRVASALTRLAMTATLCHCEEQIPHFATLHSE